MDYFDYFVSDLRGVLEPAGEPAGLDAGQVPQPTNHLVLGKTNPTDYRRNIVKCLLWQYI